LFKIGCIYLVACELGHRSLSFLTSNDHLQYASLKLSLALCFAVGTVDGSICTTEEKENASEQISHGEFQMIYNL
jgi:hypothetical protein